VHDHEVNHETLQIRAVADDPGPGALGTVSGVHLPTPAPHSMLIVLGDLHRHLRDFVLR
jgi:hypothetical protein